ncbi:MAG TPA: hypothetical protein VGX97_09790 [bacterium]|nr:hypothetical protein [bacterium]HEV2440341.1 hypothetical protein [bacterium]
MRSLFVALAAVLAIGVASPGPAGAEAALPYNLTLTGSLYSGVHPTGAIAGTFGGVAVDGQYSGGGWNLSAYGRPFAAGTYACVFVCRFTGTTLAGRPLTYAWTSQVPTWDAQTQITHGLIGGLFASRSSWAAQVAAWARANALPPSLQTRVTVDAETGM